MEAESATGMGLRYTSPFKPSGMLCEWWAQVIRSRSPRKTLLQSKSCPADILSLGRGHLACYDIVLLCLVGSAVRVEEPVGAGLAVKLVEESIVVDGVVVQEI